MSAAQLNLHTVGSLDEETSKIFRVRKTCNKMLRKRGYNIRDSEINMTTEEFKSRFGASRADLTILAESREDASDKIFVFFPEEEKVGVKQIKTYYQRMTDEGVRHAILVVKLSLTPAMKNIIREFEVKNEGRLEYFRDAELLVDITEHTLVPEHILLSLQEKKQLLDRYRLKPSQLPKIQLQDPVARYLGLRQKDVVKIIRISETSGRYVTYRICV